MYAMAIINRKKEKTNARVFPILDKNIKNRLSRPVVKYSTKRIM